MSILHRLSREEIRSRYTHTGWFAGLVPCYVGKIDTDCPDLCERNWCPEWWFDVVGTLFAGFCFVAIMLDPEFDSAFPILLTGEIG